MTQKHWTIAFGLAGIIAVTLSCISLPSYAASDEAQKAEAQRFLSKVLQETDNPLVASLAQQSLLELGATQKPTVAKAARRVEIPLASRSGKHAAIPAIVNSNILANFLVDTGATYTVITPEMARQLDIQVTPDLPTITLTTGNGRIKAPMVTLKAVSLGEIEVHNIKALVVDLGSRSLFSGVLGMNFFKNMEITLKPNRLVLEMAQ